MPNTVKELYEYIVHESARQQVSAGVMTYAVGWIFYDLFERADHEASQNGNAIKAEDLDRFAKEIPVTKLNRDIEDAQQEFGRVASAYLEDETERRIRAAVDSSILLQIRQYTSGWKSFGMNVIAGVIAGLIFAAITIFGYFIVRVDPSINGAAKVVIQREIQPPAAPSGVTAPRH